MENGHRNSGFSQLENGGSFHGKMWLFTRVCYAVFADWYRWYPCWFLIVWTARNRPHVIDSNQRFNLQTCGLGFGCWLILFMSSWSSSDLGKLKEFWLNCWTVEPWKIYVFCMIFQWFIWICSRQKGLAVDDSTFHKVLPRRSRNSSSRRKVFPSCHLASEVPRIGLREQLLGNQIRFWDYPLVN